MMIYFNYMGIIIAIYVIGIIMAIIKQINE